MNKILLLGAGRSTSSLIDYLIQRARTQEWTIRIGDYDVSHLPKVIAEHTSVEVFGFDINNTDQTLEEVGKADIVISMLPARFHIKVAKACLQQSKNLVTASYVGDEFKAIAAEAEEKGLLFLMECGLDPGIDHMTAMMAINGIKEKGGKITSFKSFTGGLIAPESDNNPWNYKFTWNPRNVVLAGQGVAKYIQQGEYKYIPYHQLFSRLEEIEVQGLGKFEGYANRDSLSYRATYGLESIPTLLRGTLRKAGYAAAWDVFVQLGITDDSYEMEGVENMNHRDFLNAFLPYATDKSVEEKLCATMGIMEDSDIFQKIAWLDLFKKTAIPVRAGTPAQVLQAILEQKLSLQKGDKDMIVMQHLFEYELEGVQHTLHSTMVTFGDDDKETAMAKTVGLPLGIAVKHILKGTVDLRGVQIPIHPSLYEPIVAELKELGIKIEEKHL